MLKRSPIILLVSVIVLLALTLQLAPIRAQNPYAVAILVVDDFTGDDLSSVPSSTSQDTCAVSLEGQAFIARGASAGSPITAAHGDLVYGQFQDMVMSLNADAFVKLVK